MEVVFQEDTETVVEMGYALVDRAKKLRSQGKNELAFKLHTRGRSMIETPFSNTEETKRGSLFIDKE